MKAKSRRRLLISSVAMLLVAMLALGTATFAWFTANPNATASGLKMKTTASAGLVARTDSDTQWGHEPALYKDQADTAVFNLNPVSMEQNTTNNFWTIEANAADNYAMKPNTEMDAATAGTYNNFENKEYYTENIYFKLSDGSNADDAAGKTVKLTGVTITANAQANNMQKAFRVCVTKSDGTILGTFATAITGDHGILVAADGANDKTPTAGVYNPALATSITTPVDTGIGNLTAAETLSHRAPRPLIGLKKQEMHPLLPSKKAMRA